MNPLPYLAAAFGSLILADTLRVGSGMRFRIRG